MGMDIYLKAPELERRRRQYQKTFHRYVRWRDQAKTNREQERYQRKVDQWYQKMYCGNMGYFRVSYNPYSISYWLEYNIDPDAKGAWGIEPFYSASQARKDRAITDVAFHKNLLKTAKTWYKKALDLKDKESVIVEMRYDSKDPENRRLIKKPVSLTPQQTNDYIAWLKELVDFAQLAVKTKAPIEVSA